MAHPNLIETPSSSTVAAFGSFTLQVGDSTKALFVEFKSGKIYRYDVPEQVALDMDSASSKGTFVNQMKTNYVGQLVDAVDVTNLIQAAFGATKTAKKVKKKAVKLTDAFIAMYPQLRYFF